MIGGEVARSALRLAMLLVVLSAVTVLFEDRSTPEFVVSVMALAVSVMFLTVVLVLARMSSARSPQGDKRRSNDYNGTDPRTGDRSHGRGT
jgi:NADH:ubiquinone oxidoreductase subunit 6 (subunit J)